MTLDRLGTIFLWFLKTSLSASVLVLAIIAVKTLFSKKLSSRWHYLIWYLLLFALVNPYNVKTNLGIHNFFQAEKTKIGDKVQKAFSENFNTLLNAKPEAAKPMKNAYEEDGSIDMQKSSEKTGAQISKEASSSNSNPALELISLAWLIGCTALMVIVISANMLFHKKIKNKRITVDGDTAGILDECMNAMGIKKEIGLFKAEGIRSPILHGVFNPSIILPVNIEEKFSTNDLKYIFLHELSHMKARDILINYFIVLLKVIYWFNPVIHYGFYRMKQDREISRDAMALSFTDISENRAYAFTIIKLLEIFSRNPQYIMSTGILEGTSNIKNRILQIKNFNGIGRRLSPLGILTIAIMVFFLITGPSGAIVKGISENFKKINPNDEVILTINRDIQKITENSLRKAIKEHKASQGTAIVMETKTGRILSIVNLNKNNLNESYKYDKLYKDCEIFSKTSSDYGIVKSYEVGSIMKPFVAAAALNEGKTNLNEKLNCKGYVTVNGRKIDCWLYSVSNHGHGILNLAGAVETSCSSIFIQLGQRLGWIEFEKYAKGFGFGKKTGIDIPGELNGTIDERTKTDQIEQALSYIGTGIRATNIQVLNAINCLGNQGKLMKPYIIENVKRDGKIVYSGKPNVLRQVVTKDTSDKMVKLMKENVLYRMTAIGNPSKLGIAARTATVYKLKDNRYRGDYTACASGFGPVENPKISVVVFMDEPEKNSSAAVVAAPVLRDILVKSVKYIK